MSAVRRGPAMRRSTLFAGLLVAALLVGCEGRSPTSSDGSPMSAGIALAISMQQAATTGGGEADAYAEVNGIEIVVRIADGPVLLDRTYPFDPQASETRIPINVPVDGATQATLEVVLFNSSGQVLDQGTGIVPLFTGTAPLQLTPNEVSTADLVLVPVAAGISVPDTLPPLVSIGETRPLPGTILFATGDTAATVHVSWLSLTPQTVAVQSTDTTSSVVALSTGAGRLLAFYGSYSDTVSVTVEQVTAQVAVQPATLSLSLGDTARVTAAALDAGGTQIPGRTPTWSTSDSTVAAVGAKGLIQARGAGTATISAMMDGVTGSATVDVTAPPGVKTLGPSGVGASDATLQGTVNPNNGQTSAWFEWGTDPRFGTYTQTSAVDLGSGTSEVQTTATVSGLKPDVTYYYRVAASNLAGSTRGSAVGFATQPMAPSNFSASFDGDLYMNWQDNSVTETSFVVERSTTSATSGFNTSSTWGANALGGSETAPFPAQILYYRVRACNSWGCSPPSNVDTLVAPNPSIQGTVYLCYSAGTTSCVVYGSQTVLLGGAVTDSTVTAAQYGTYYFYTGLTGGSTYTVSVRDVACQAAFRQNQFTIVPGWGETVTQDFYADTILCAAPVGANGAGGFDPVVARFLGIDESTTSARAGPAPR